MFRSVEGGVLTDELVGDQHRVHARISRDARFVFSSAYPVHLLIERLESAFASIRLSLLKQEPLQPLEDLVSATRPLPDCLRDEPRLHAEQRDGVWF